MLESNPILIFFLLQIYSKIMQEHTLKDTLKNWRAKIKPYQTPQTSKAIIQLLNSFLPFIGLCVLMYFSLNWSYLITIALAGIAALFLVRIFIIQHDCGHQSFLKSRKWNNIIGFVSSLFSTVPFTYWSRSHNIHHAHNGQLEYRGIGDIHFLTTDEYSKLSLWRKLSYRIFRSGFVQFVISPIAFLLVILRYPFVRQKGWKKIRWSFFSNNFIVIGAYTLLAIILGWQYLILVQVPVLLFFSVIAFWFFFIQHQHEENYKEWKDNWDHLLASIRGSTYYKLPRLFQWLSGNIGFHHIHHLNPRIPNYHLEACARENPLLNKYVNTLSFWQSLKCINYKLWDEQKKQMISFKEYHRMVST